MSKRKRIIVTIAGISTGVIIGVPIIQKSFQLVERYQIHPVVALLGYTAVGVLLWHLADILEEMAYRPRLSKTKRNTRNEIT